jgi:hypothetical protein
MNAQEESEVTGNGNLEMENNIFSQPWNDSDVVLVVEDKEFHVHRSILTLQSEVFKVMFKGNFEDATKDRIELKGDKYEAMLQFLKLLYPTSMLDIDSDQGEIDISDEKIFNILELADKYAAKNIIKQCMKEVERLKPENIMRLLPYAARHELPFEKIFDVIARRVSTNKLENFAPELTQLNSNDSVYDQCLVKKCRFLENVAKQANSMILWLLQEVVEKVQDAESKNETSTGSLFGKGYVIFSANHAAVQCVLQHGYLTARDFKKTKNCTYCLTAYQKSLIEEYVFSKSSSLCGGLHNARLSTGSGMSIRFQNSTFTSSDLINLLTLLEPLDNME